MGTAKMVIYSRQHPSIIDRATFDALGQMVEPAGTSPRTAGTLGTTKWKRELRRLTGGERGIRTLGTLARSTVFETAPFNHSGTSPHQLKSARITRPGLSIRQIAGRQDVGSGNCGSIRLRAYTPALQDDKCLTSAALWGLWPPRRGAEAFRATLCLKNAGFEIYPGLTNCWTQAVRR